MELSVVIPAYNAEATIEATLLSVLSQTREPDEILVIDDGSTDSTLAILGRYQSRITILRQSNAGVAAARNVLCEQAKGQLIAFLDNDDIWHRRYLEVQCRLYEEFPNAVAFFTDHVNFVEGRENEWADGDCAVPVTPELISPLDFLETYHRNPFPFSSATFCCIPRRILSRIGERPFCVEVSGADDFHLLHVLPLMGPIVFAPVRLAAYRVRPGSVASNSLKLTGLALRSMEILESRYRSEAGSEMRNAFERAFASKRREFAKRLMSAGKTFEAQKQLWLSAGESSNPESIAKSFGLLLFSYLPAVLQPKWLPTTRE